VKKTLIASILLLPIVAFAGEATKETETEKLQKALAQSVVENLKLRKELAAERMKRLIKDYAAARAEWKELLKALGEPDPDAPPAKTDTKEKPQ
jgi:hypothetical protein